MNKEEKRAYHRAWYAKQSLERKALKNDLQKKRRHDIRQWINDIKKTLTCTKCSENHISCLDFHHLDSSKKEISLSNAITQGWSKKRLLEEMNKCIILCSNCHRKLHYEE